MSFPLTIPELVKQAPKAGISVVSDKKSRKISGISTVAGARPGELLFLWTVSALVDVLSTFNDEQMPGGLVLSESLLLVENRSQVDPQCWPTLEAWMNAGVVVLKTPRADVAMIEVCDALGIDSPKSKRPHVHPTAVIAPSARIASLVSIGAYCVIGDDVCIAEGCQLDSHVVLEDRVSIGLDTLIMHHSVIGRDTHVGRRVVIKPGAVIGTHGFGFAQTRDGHRLLPHLGRVVIEDDVQVGANSCIDRAKGGETRIGKGTKIDNMCHIGHNVRIGDHCLIAAQFGAGGSGVMGNHVMAGGQTGMYDHVSIPDGTHLGLRAAVTKSPKARGVLAGSPAMPLSLFLKSWAIFKELPKLKKDLEALKREQGRRS